MPCIALKVSRLLPITWRIIDLEGKPVIADLAKGTGRFNLAQGVVGTLSGVGASLSTSISGLVVERFGNMAGFLGVTTVGLMAVAVLWAFMPETKSSALHP